MSRNQLNFIFLMILLSSCKAFAGSQSFTFNETSSVKTSELLWNSNLGGYHPGFYVDNINDGGAQAPVTLDMGDASDGVFNLATYASFSEAGDVSGNIIRLNTDTYPVLNLSSFTLDATWTLRPTGSKPLIIRSHGDVIINGSVDCSGGVGSSASAVGTDVPVGGVGVCGGLNGGEGGNDTLFGVSGGDHAGLLTRGLGAASTTDGSSGGGGGGFGIGGFPAQPGLGGSSGGAGLTIIDNLISVLQAGAGGGGGARSTGDGSSGAAGGAGGGYIYIVTAKDITISAGATVLADGGNGGSAGALLGGGGGAGGGGTVVLFAAGSMTIDGNVSAVGGTGGTSAGNAGGNGSIGRTWITDLDMAGINFGNVNPVSVLASFGDVDFNTGTFKVELKPTNSASTYPTLTSLEVQGTIPSGSTVSPMVYSSASNTVNPTTEFASLVSALNTKSKQYMYIRFDVSSANKDAPVVLTGATVDWIDYEVNEFDFKSACGSTTSGNFPFTPVALLLLPLLSYLYLRKYQLNIISE